MEKLEFNDLENVTGGGAITEDVHAWWCGECNDRSDKALKGITHCLASFDNHVSHEHESIRKKVFCEKKCIGCYRQIR